MRNRIMILPAIILNNFKKVIIYIWQFIKRNPFFLLAIPFFYISGEDYYYLWFFNKLSIQLFLPFIFIFLGFWFQAKKEDLSRNAILAFGSIAVAVTFFIISSAYTSRSTLILLQAVTRENCTKVAGILELENLEKIESRYALSQFITDPYFNYVDFIYRYSGIQDGDNIFYNVMQLGLMNGLISQVWGLNIEGTNPQSAQSVKSSVSMYNTQLLEKAKSAQSSFCNKPFLEKNN